MTCAGMRSVNCSSRVEVCLVVAVLISHRRSCSQNLFIHQAVCLTESRHTSSMTSSSKQKEEVHVANGGVKQSTWSKAISCKAVWNEKDEFLDVVYWFRQIIAIILGVIWGVAPLKGFLGIAIFCIINAGVLYVYFSSFQQVDEEEYGEHGSSPKKAL